MKYEKKHLILPVFITGICLVVATHNLVTQSEYYPFAAYNMYSFPVLERQHYNFTIQFYNNSKLIPFDQNRVSPWNVGRLNTYLRALYLKKDQKQIDIILKEILDLNPNVNEIHAVMHVWDRLTLNNLPYPNISARIGSVKLLQK